MISHRGEICHPETLINYEISVSNTNAARKREVNLRVCLKAWAENQSGQTSAG